MLGTLDDALGRACARWIDWVQPRAGWVVAAFLAGSLALLAAAAPRLAVDSNEDILFSEELPFVPRRAHWRTLFPQFQDPILVVVDAETPDRAQSATDRLVAHLAEDPERFPRIDHVGGGSFFEAHGLLYLERAELEDLSDRLAAAQPFLGSLSRDPSLRGLLPLLGDALEFAQEGELRAVDLADALDRVAEVVEAHAMGRDASLAWSSWIRGDADYAGGLRQFVLVQPAYDFEQVNPAEATVHALRDVFRELELQGDGSARARMTGVYVLAEEESRHVTSQSTWAGLASFLLVGMVLGFGLRSWRIVGSALVTLAVGLALTAAIAAGTIGRLNLISVAFAVLFIGLSIDFAIHLCVPYLDELARGESRARALRSAARGVGGSLAICAVTTAIGFFAFAPTDYRGVAELGMIAGSGMFVSLFTNLTLLPALLSLGRADRPAARARSARVSALLSVPTRHRLGVLSVAAILMALALFTLPRVTFDLNPLRMRDPGAESVVLFDELLERGEAVVWNLSATAPDRAAAERLAADLEALPEVDRSLTLSDFVPDDQAAKLAVLDDLGFLLGPGLANPALPAPDAREREAAVDDLTARLGRLERSSLAPEVVAATERLDTALRALEEAMPAGEAGARALAALDRSLTGTLPTQLDMLRTALTAGVVTPEDLPDELLASWVATDGSVRVEVFPAEDLNDNEALADYVNGVLSVAPEAYGEGFTIYLAGKAVETSLLEALSLAGLLIGGVLLILWRHVPSALLVMLPIALAALVTAASTVWIGLPLNFANVIVIPLLLGMGVDTGIHLVHRIRAGGLPREGLLGTSTARAVLLSALTTLASFGSLSLSTHPGLASLGRLLALGLALILLSNLGLLPALARPADDRVEPASRD